MYVETARVARVRNQLFDPGDQARIFWHRPVQEISEYARKLNFAFFGFHEQVYASSVAGLVFGCRYDLEELL